MTDKDNLVFVYGTAMSGYARCAAMASSIFVEAVVTSLPIYRMYSAGNMPGVVLQPMRGSYIAGELYKVTDERLEELDHLEGVSDGLFMRIKIVVGSYDIEKPNTVAYMYIVSDPQFLRSMSELQCEPEANTYAWTKG